MCVFEDLFSRRNAIHGPWCGKRELARTIRENIMQLNVLFPGATVTWSKTPVAAVSADGAKAYRETNIISSTKYVIKLQFKRHIKFKCTQL